MSKNLQVNLTFNADTTAAKQQIQSLQQSLSNLMTMPMQAGNINVMRKDLSDAIAKTAELKVALQNATNVKTGKLDFSKFNQQLKSGQTSLQQYAMALQKLGPQGTQAFAQLANAIRQSELPVLKLKGKIASLGQTLMNTAKWQISSSLLHGLISSFSSVINYAKDLNESLNNIRIVTGKSVDEMSRFAKEANQAAKNLSATTTEYTNASLIYYQQGLSDADVKKRTETTLKLAKVVGEEAATVSEWMTAIWNNFDDGTRSLEHYADVLTALGAATASSADEIAGGLEKFASVAETVGLSYEYAASALATITAETRQSEEVVGTALKTIFARIEGLNLGETLEDGTTLNKYSEGLYKVGINIKDQNGELKQMDSILDEMGSRWQHLSKDQQVALAQTVAGVRQYNQFISLMSNWDVMKENLNISKNATGELERQHIIYEEGIEGATARVKAQLEEIKNALVDENDLVPWLNGLEKILDVVGSLLKSIGGLPGLLTIIASSMLKIYGPQVANGIKNLTSNIMQMRDVMNGTAQQERSSMITQSSKIAAAMAMESNMGNETSAQLSNNLERNANLTKLEEESANKINQEYKETLGLLRQVLEQKEQIALKSSEEIDAAAKAGMQAEARLHTRGFNTEQTDALRRAGAYEGSVEHMDNTNYRSSEALNRDASAIVASAEEALGGPNATTEDANQLEALRGAKESLMKAEEDYQAVKKQVQDLQKKGNKLTDEEKQKLSKLEQQQKTLKKERDKQKTTFAATAKSINVASRAEAQYANTSEDAQREVHELVESEKQAEMARRKKTQATKEADAIEDQYRKTNEEGVKVGQHWSTTLTAGMQKTASVTSGIMMVTNAFSSLNESIANGTAGFSDYLSFATSLLFGLGQLMPLFSGVAGAIKTVSIAHKAANAEGKQNILTTMGQVLAEKLHIKTKKDEQKEIVKTTGVQQLEEGSDMLDISTDIAQQTAEGPKGWATAAISAALVAAIIGASIAVSAANKPQNDDEEEEAQRTQQYANQVAEAYDKVRESYDKLKESFENYHSAQEAIGKLQKGTLEWKQAIQEANQQVIELMDAYPELAQYVSNVEGRLMISEEGQRALLEQEGQKVTALSNIKINAQQNAKQARYEADKKAELTTTFDTAGAWEFMGHMFSGGIFTGEGGAHADDTNLFGAATGTGSLGSGIYGAIKNNEIEYQRSEDALNALSELYLEQGEAMFADFDKTLADLNITDTELVNKLKENKEVTEELVRTNAQLVDQNKIIDQQKVDNLLMGQEHFITDNYGAGVQEAMVEHYQNAKEQVSKDIGSYEDWTTGGWDEFWTFGAVAGTDKGEAAFQEYAEIMGYDNAESTDFKGDKVVFKYKDGDEVKEDLEVSYDDMRSAIEEYRVAKQAADMANKANTMTSQIRMLGNSDNTQDQALSSFLEHGNLGYLDPEVYDKITADGFSISTEQAELFGMTVEEATEKFKKAYEAYDPILARNNILAQEQQAINTILVDGAAELEQSETALRAYAETLANNSDYLDENKESAAKMAVAHYRTAIGISNLKKALNDNLKVLKDSSANSLDYAEALGSVKDSLEQAFGVKVSADFVKKNLGKIEAMANGSTEALQALRKELVIDTISNMALDDSYKTALQNELTELMEIAENSPIGMQLELDNSKAIEGINEALKAGTMTVQEVEALFANANLAMPQYNTVKVPNTTTSKSHTVTSAWWGEMEMDSTTTNTTWSEIPYFGDNPPQYDADGNQKEGTGVESSLKLTTTANSDADQDILNYGGKGATAGESSSDKAKRTKELDNEITRYRLLNEQVEDLERNMDAVGKAKDRAVGGQKLALMKQEQELLKQDLELEKERLKQAEEYYQQDLNELGKYGIQTDEKGQVLNWDEQIKKQTDKMKAMSDPNSESYKEEKQRLDDMKKAYDKYMKTLDEVKDSQQNVIDKQNAIVDAALEEAEFKVEFQLEIDEFTMSILEHFLTRLEDDAFAAADAIALIGQQMEVTAGQIDTYMTGINKVLGATLSPEEIQKVMAGDLSGIDTSKLTEQQIEDLKEYANGLMEVETQLREQHTAVHEKLTETIEAWNEEFDKNMAKFEKYNAVVENYKNIIDIVGKGTLGISNETMHNMYEAQKNIATDQLEAARIRKESAQTTYDEMKIAYDNAVMQYGEDSEIAKKWKEQMDITEESLDEATSEFQEAWQNALQAAADAFQHNVETIIQNFEKSIAGIYGSLEALEEAMERQKEINERYLQDYEKTYEINKLNRKITQDIAKTTSNKSAKELHDLQNELLEMSKEGNQISKLDIEYMQKKYDLLLAEQALHDAQNAKSTVKLSRDSEGNYSYVYTADQNNVDQAMQTYEDAKYALEDWSRTSLETVSENIIQIYSAWSQAMQEIMMDNTLNEEEREHRMAETNQYYLELMSYYTDEAAKLTEYGYQTNSQYHTDMADSINDSIVGHIMPDITDWKILYTKYSGEMEKATNNLNGAILQFKKDIDTNLVAAGGSAKTFETTMNQHLFNVQTQAGTTKDAIIKIKTEAEAQLPLAVSAASAFETNFNNHLNNVINKIGDPALRTGLIGALLNLTDQCKDTLNAQYAVETKDYSYVGKEVPDSDNGNGNIPIVNNDSDTTTNYIPLETKTIGDRKYAKYNGYWYTKGSANSQEWRDFQSGKSTDTTKLHQVVSGRKDSKSSENIVKDLQDYLSKLQEDDGIELTKDTTLYGTFSQGKGFDNPVDFTDEGAHPDVEVLDLVHWLIGGMYRYMAKIKVTGDAGDGVLEGETYWVDVNDLNKGGSLDYYNTSGLSFDTGGYTGSWGPEGRLAMLHQKEIVLNAHDTENLLSIISMVRDMNDRIELNARAMQYGLTAAYSASNIKSQNDTLQQEVHITAEFPNATNHFEIEEAFRNLTNLASQYANRKF